MTLVGREMQSPRAIEHALHVVGSSDVLHVDKFERRVGYPARDDAHGSAIRRIAHLAGGDR